MKTVIMAGGKGTRISSVASDIPKPMIKIEGKPVLEEGNGAYTTALACHGTDPSFEGNHPISLSGGF